LDVINLSWQETLPIRHVVLWPNETPEFCKVKGDDEALHFGVIINEKIVCVASIYINANSARLRKFATLNQYQGKGVGSFLLKHLITKLKARDINHLWFDARESAIGFYTRLGFTVTGELFYKQKISYYKMSANL
jgi:ribosomal protein S18 acetylase RimI-like enzyme